MRLKPVLSETVAWPMALLLAITWLFQDFITATPAVVPIVNQPFLYRSAHHGYRVPYHDDVARRRVCAGRPQCRSCDARHSWGTICLARKGKGFENRHFHPGFRCRHHRSDSVDSADSGIQVQQTLQANTGDFLAGVLGELRPARTQELRRMGEDEAGGA